MKGNEKITLQGERRTAEQNVSQINLANCEKKTGSKRDSKGITRVVLSEIYISVKTFDA
jgi:hypothetical protein